MSAMPRDAAVHRHVYVPSNGDGSVTVIDQQTMKVIKHYRVGRLVQHVVASWDPTKLYATASGSNSLVEIDPATGDKGRSIQRAYRCSGVASFYLAAARFSLERPALPL